MTYVHSSSVVPENSKEIFSYCQIKANYIARKTSSSEVTVWLVTSAGKPKSRRGALCAVQVGDAGDKQTEPEAWDGSCANVCSDSIKRLLHHFGKLLSVWLTAPLLNQRNHCVHVWVNSFCNWATHRYTSSESLNRHKQCGRLSADSACVFRKAHLSSLTGELCIRRPHSPFLQTFQEARPDPEEFS